MDKPDESFRVAFFSDSALPVLNGVSVSIDLLVQELRRRGHSIHLYTNGVPGHRDSDPNVYRFRSIETPWSKGYPLAFPPFYRMLLKFRRHCYDLIHTHSPWTIGFVGLRWAESHCIPIVSTYHTLYDRYVHYLPGPRRYLRYKIAKHTNYYYNRVQHVLTPSEAALRWLRRHSVSTPISVVPTGNAPPVPFQKEEVRITLGIAPQSRVLLYVGRLAKEKNLETLIHATKEVMASDPHIMLLLVGDGPHRGPCTSLVRHVGIGDRVRFVGFVPRSEVERYYAAADLFVFPSVTETQGLVIQEAMAHGLPAVVIHGGGAAESLRDGESGLLVPNDKDAFAKAVNTILGSESLRTRMGHAARARHGEQSLSAMCDQVESIYRQVISQATITVDGRDRCAS